MKQLCAIGFTLIELLVVVTIIVVLLAMLMPALDRALSQTEIVRCMANMDAIGKGFFQYTLDHKGTIPHLEVSFPPGRAEKGDLIYPPDRYGTYVWMDELRDLGYVGAKKAFDCPSASEHPLRPDWAVVGIAINHPYLTPWAPNKLRRQQVKQPGRTVLFADAGRISVSTYTNTDPDAWMEDAGYQNHYFLTPDHGHFHTPPSDDLLNGRQRRAFNRHKGGETTATAHVDGHAEAMAVSEIGFQYWPGTASDGTVAHGKTPGVGNGKTDPRWMWDAD